MAGSALISFIVLWLWLCPDCAGKWFFKARKKYLELKETHGGGE